MSNILNHLRVGVFFSHLRVEVIDLQRCSVTFVRNPHIEEHDRTILVWTFQPKDFVNLNNMFKEQVDSVLVVMVVKKVQIFAFPKKFWILITMEDKFLEWILPQTTLALEAFLLVSYRIGTEFQDSPSPPTCIDLLSPAGSSLKLMRSHRHPRLDLLRLA